MLLVAASAVAQDSYRDAIKDYLFSSGQYERNLTLISDLSMLFDKNGPVDIDQLTKRYLDEQFENEMIDFLQPIMTSHGITEADLKEVSSLLAMPENKTFEAHQKDWMAGFLTDFLTPFMEMGENMETDEDAETKEDMDMSHGGLMTLLGPPVQVRADIDAAYADKFRQVMLESPLVKNMLDAAMKRFNEGPDGETKKQEDREAFNHWMKSTWPNILLNNAYGTLTLEDLDQAALLYSNDSYCKVAMLDSEASEDFKTDNVIIRYSKWMEEQGATLSEDPENAMEFLKSFLNLDGLDLDKSDLEDINSDD